jgi:hypothetical protein
MTLYSAEKWMPVIAEVSWDYHRGAKESRIQVLNSWFVLVGSRAILDSRSQT